MIPTRLHQRSNEFRFAGFVQNTHYISIVWVLTDQDTTRYPFLDTGEPRLNCYYDPHQITSDESPVIAVLEQTQVSRKLVLPKIAEAAVALETLSPERAYRVKSKSIWDQQYTSLKLTRYFVPRKLVLPTFPSVVCYKNWPKCWGWAIDRNLVVHVVKQSHEIGMFDISGVYSNYKYNVLPVAVDKFWRS